MKRRPSEELLSEAEPATEDGKGHSEKFSFSLGLLLVSCQLCGHTHTAVTNISCFRVYFSKHKL